VPGRAGIDSTDVKTVIVSDPLITTQLAPAQLWGACFAAGPKDYLLGRMYLSNYGMRFLYLRLHPALT
jgi:hypothetical protein